MNILHIIEDFRLVSGGVRTVVKELNDNLNKQQSINSYIISSKKEEDDDIYTVTNSQGKPWLYSRDWKQNIEKIIIEKKIQLIHIHGVWMFPQYISARIAVKNKMPFIITPHGMYEPWLWTKGTLKKKTYFRVFCKNLFSKAYRIHAITKKEESNLKKILPNAKFIEIPNLVDTKHISLPDRIDFDKKYILYLGRLHEIKGIENLIESFNNIENKDIKLAIAGAFNDYKSKLELLVNKLGLENKVDFLGLIKGQEKINLFNNAFVFVTPSFSEVIGMVNLESALHRTPVITTYQTGLMKEWNENGGILINPNQNELTAALNKALNWSLEERNKKGDNLFKFVKKNYSWESRLTDWIQLYTNAIKTNK